jgi:hypothetical protein
LFHSAIDVLVGKNQVLEKIYGKQKVYVIVQDMGETDEEMVSLSIRQPIAVFSQYFSRTASDPASYA